MMESSYGFARLESTIVLIFDVTRSRHPARADGTYKAGVAVGSHCARRLAPIAVEGAVDRAVRPARRIFGP